MFAQPEKAASEQELVEKEIVCGPIHAPTDERIANRAVLTWSGDDKVPVAVNGVFVAVVLQRHHTVVCHELRSEKMRERRSI